MVALVLPGANCQTRGAVINVDPNAWHRYGPELVGDEAYEDYQRAIHDPGTVHVKCEDYRAGLGIDRAHDDEDRRVGRRVTCLLLALWAAMDDLPDLYG